MADVAVFVSYNHDDNKATYDRIIKISNDAQRVYKTLSGLEVGLFIDIESITLGEQWRGRIRSGLTNASILLAFISPLCLGSAPCREEFQSFVWTASQADSRKLIIPLLFTPKENIEARFQDDELWAQVAKLQYLEIHELCKSDPGSGQWMDKVEIIAERMRSVLDVPDLSVPPPTGPTEAQEPPTPEQGDFDLLREYDQAFQPVIGTIQDLAEIFFEFDDSVVAATPRLTAAANFSQRLEVSNELADELTPIVDSFSDRVQDFQRHLDAADPLVHAVFRMLKVSPSIRQSEEAREFIKSEKALAEALIGNITSMLRTYEPIYALKGFSSKLEKPLQRMQSSLLIMAGNRGIFVNWLEEAEELGPNGSAKSEP